MVGVTLTLLAAVAPADRLITIPTGRKLPYGTVRYEFRYQPFEGGTQENLLGLGISTAFDMEIRTDRGIGESTTGTFDIAYNLIAALPGLSPGISFGVQDALDHTPDGRRFFGVVTFREPFSTINGDFPADITVGVMGAKKVTPIVGVEVPFSKEVHLLVEHNGLRIASGMEFRPKPWLNLRAQIIGTRTELSAQVTTHF